MKRVGILGGSFNPVHSGHLRLAGYIADNCRGIDSVWLSLSPANPLKEPLADPAADDDRLAMLRLAVEPLRPRVDYTSIELDLPRPSYTINTLRELARRYPDHSFKLIIGSDNWLIIDRWRCWQEIINEFGVIVYPRPGYDVDPTSLPDGVELIEGAPLMDVSSTEIRERLSRGEPIDGLVPQAVATYLYNKQKESN